jgi:hypothetical protein
LIHEVPISPCLEWEEKNGWAGHSKISDLTIERSSIIFTARGGTHSGVFEVLIMQKTVACSDWSLPGRVVVVAFDRVVALIGWWRW